MTGASSHGHGPSPEQLKKILTSIAQPSNPGLLHAAPSSSPLSPPLSAVAPKAATAQVAPPAPQPATKSTASSVPPPATPPATKRIRPTFSDRMADINFTRITPRDVVEILGVVGVAATMAWGGMTAWKWINQERPAAEPTASEAAMNSHLASYEQGGRNPAFATNFRNYQALDQKIKGELERIFVSSDTISELMRAFAAGEVCRPAGYDTCLYEAKRNYVNLVDPATLRPSGAPEDTDLVLPNPSIPTYSTTFNSEDVSFGAARDTVSRNLHLSIEWQPYAEVAPTYIVNLDTAQSGGDLASLRQLTSFFDFPAAMWDTCSRLTGDARHQETRHNQRYGCSIYTPADGSAPRVSFVMEQYGYFPEASGGAYTNNAWTSAAPDILGERRRAMEVSRPVVATIPDRTVVVPDHRPVAELTTEQRTALADYVAYQQQLIGEIKRRLGDGRVCGVTEPCDARGRPDPAGVSEYGHPYSFSASSLMVPATVTFQMSFEGIDRNSSDSAINVAVNFALNRQSDAPIQTYLNHKAVGIMSALRPIPAEVTAACDGTPQEVNGTIYTCTRDARSVSIGFRAPGPFQSRP